MYGNDINNDFVSNYVTCITEGETMGRIFNFSAGPAMLPEEVLKEAAEEMLDYRGCGMSVMEMSHRSKVFDDIIKEAEKDLRELMISFRITTR